MLSGLKRVYSVRRVRAGLLVYALLTFAGCGNGDNITTSSVDNRSEGIHRTISNDKMETAADEITWPSGQIKDNRREGTESGVTGGGTPNENSAWVTPNRNKGKDNYCNKANNACLTCHTQQIEELLTYKSKHSKLTCSFCHNEHGWIPACTQCHESHSAIMVQNDCKACHQAHMPTNVIYSAATPSKFCAVCHKKAYDLLVSSTTKHSKLACAYCHSAKHGTVPLCTQCHGNPHTDTTAPKATKCGKCHNTAHDLNVDRP